MANHINYATFEKKMTTMINVKMNPPLTNLQAELLKLFARQIPDEQLEELKNVIARFLLEKARDKADKIWDEKGYDEQAIDKLLQKK